MVCIISIIIARKEKVFTRTMKKELIAGNWLGDDHINLAQELLNEEYPNLHGLQSPLLCQNDSFCPIAGDSIQIHFVSNNHWVTSACFNEEATIYDSKYNGELPPSLTHQLAIIYKQFADNDDETFLNLNVPNVQQQTGVDDWIVCKCLCSTCCTLRLCERA